MNDQSFADLERLNLVWHCGRFGNLMSESPGWTVTNGLVPTPMFNFSTGLERLDEIGLEQRSRDISHREWPVVLWRGTPPFTPGLAWRPLVTYRVMRRLPGGEPPAAHPCRILWTPEERSEQAAHLLCEAHGEPRVRPYFDFLLQDREVIWVVNDGGACVLRRKFSLIGGYDLAVLPEQRRSGYGLSLKRYMIRIANMLNLPLVSHARPGSIMESINRSEGYEPVFDDTFFRLEPGDRSTMRPVTSSGNG